MINITTNEEFIQTIIKNSEKEELFIIELKNEIGKINISDISDHVSLKRVV